MVGVGNFATFGMAFFRGIGTDGVLWGSVGGGRVCCSSLSFPLVSSSFDSSKGLDERIDFAGSFFLFGSCFSFVPFLGATADDDFLTAGLIVGSTLLERTFLDVFESDALRSLRGISSSEESRPSFTGGEVSIVLFFGDLSLKRILKKREKKAMPTSAAN